VLLARLAEAEETLHALREGEVDALVVRGSRGDRIYTLHGADEPYRNLVEQMWEGAVVLAPSGDILYCNGRFAALVGEPPGSVLGRHIGRFMFEADRADFTALLNSGAGTRRSRLVAADGASVDAYFSLMTTVSAEGPGNLSLIVADLSDILEGGLRTIGRSGIRSSPRQAGGRLGSRAAADRRPGQSSRTLLSRPDLREEIRRDPKRSEDPKVSWDHEK
jgi:hypothetical protein